MHRGVPMIAVAAILATRAALANDSTAEKVAGGLVLTRTDAIEMVSEDLYISPRQVNVAYVFRNRMRAPVRTTVAFPMPDRDLAELRISDTSYPTGFRTLVDGRAVTMHVERRAFLNGIEHTAMLTALGVPVQDGDPDGPRLENALNRLRPADRRRLLELGLAAQGGARLYPAWTMRETYYWEQVFPAGRPLNVRHSYVPGVGGSVSVALGSVVYRDTAEGREEQARHCTSRDFIASVDRLMRQEGQGIYSSEQRLGYILTTGGNWRSPIGRFRLVVDKLDPRAIVSFCGRGVRRIGPTRFEVRHSNWRPTRDLHILIVTPHPQAQ